MSERVHRGQPNIDVTTNVFVCRPPRSILHDDGSLSTVIAEPIDDETHESVPVALMRTEHGYDDSGPGFSRVYRDGTFWRPASRVSAVVQGVTTREAVVPQDPKRTYEKRIRKAQRDMSQTLLATMNLTN